MPFFRVSVEGTGFEFGAESGAPVRGFFATRFVKADSEQMASSLAQSGIEDEWAKGAYSALNVRPQVTVSKVERVGFLSRFGAKNTGYVFYST